MEVHARNERRIKVEHDSGPITKSLMESRLPFGHDGFRERYRGHHAERAVAVEPLGDLVALRGREAGEMLLDPLEPGLGATRRRDFGEKPACDFDAKVERRATRLSERVLSLRCK